MIQIPGGLRFKWLFASCRNFPDSKHTHRIHVWYITYSYHKFKQHVGKYSIHGSHGNGFLFGIVSSFFLELEKCKLPETTVFIENRPLQKGDSYWKPQFLGAIIVSLRESLC